MPPTDPPARPRPSWKQASKPSASRRKASGPKWKKDAEAASGGTGRRSRALRLVGAIVASLVCCGLLIWIALWLRPLRPSGLVLLGAGYETDLAVPPNVVGWNGLKALTELARPSRTSRGRSEAARFQAAGDGPARVAEGSAWDGDLARVAEKTVIVVMAMHGAADQRGPYLILDDATADGSERHKLRIEAVLNRLRPLAEGGKNVVLVLDATQPQAIWPMGVIHNTFADALKAMEPEILKIPRLIVLSASDVDQRSWASDDWRQTAFVHFLIEGLKGAKKSDLTASRRTDGRIDALELFEFVEESVRSWAATNREALQTPVLLPTGAEGRRRASRMELALEPSSYVPPDPHQTPDLVSPRELADAWALHDSLSKGEPSPATYAPRLWRLFRDSLLRYDALVRAGETEKSPKLSAGLKRLAEEIRRAGIVDLKSSRNSFAMTAATGRPRSGNPSADARFLALWNDPPDEAEARWKGFLDAASNEESRHALRRIVAEAAVRRAADDPGSDLAKARKLLDLVLPPGVPAPVECTT